MNRLSKYKVMPVLLLAVLLLAGTAAFAQRDIDLLIKNAYVFDGSGSDSIRLNVGVKGERIVFIGKDISTLRAKEVIDAEGLYLSPGFIDPHTHYLAQLSSKKPAERGVLPALAQGVTTVFLGNDGSGPVPIDSTLKSWEANGIGPNAGLFIGHNTVRLDVIGAKDVRATAAQIEKMKSLVAQSMKAGAFGISTGLFYTPGNYADLSEVVELSRVAAAYGGIYDTHQRDEGSQSVGVVRSTQEVLDVAEKAGIPVHISHIKVAGPKVWGESKTIIKMIEGARKKGLDVTASLYPYEASQTSLSAALVPAWVRDGGNAGMKERFNQPELRDSILKGIHESIMARTADPGKLVISGAKDASIDGKNLAAVATAWNMTAEEAVIKICSDSSPSLHSFMMTDGDIRNFMVQPWVMTCSDGGSGHPRAYGSFARMLRVYALDRSVLSLSKAIHQSSGLTATTLKIKDRGFIKEGYFADLVLFDPKLVKDNATYDKADQLATGVNYVIVNGQIAIREGAYQNGLYGKSLRK